MSTQKLEEPPFPKALSFEAIERVGDTVKNLKAAKMVVEIGENLPQDEAMAADLLVSLSETRAHLLLLVDLLDQALWSVVRARSALVHNAPDKSPAGEQGGLH